MTDEESEVHIVRTVVDTSGKTVARRQWTIGKLAEFRETRPLITLDPKGVPFIAATLDRLTPEDRLDGQFSKYDALFLMKMIP